MLYFHFVMIIYAFSSNKFRRWRRGLPVSYTHLDVYKRQVRKSAVGTTISTAWRGWCTARKPRRDTSTTTTRRVKWHESATICRIGRRRANTTWRIVRCVWKRRRTRSTVSYTHLFSLQTVPKHLQKRECHFDYCRGRCLCIQYTDHI